MCLCFFVKVEPNNVTICLTKVSLNIIQLKEQATIFIVENIFNLFYETRFISR